MTALTTMQSSSKIKSIKKWLREK